jgi:phosphinothricin acetyltransferase
MTDTRSDARIRAARPADLPALTDLYNHYVTSSPATFDIEPFTLAERREWMDHHAERGPHRLLVAEDAAGRLLGYTGTGRFRPKAAYETSVETTVYLAPDATGRGLGRMLYAALFDVIAGEDVHRAFAGITMPNPASEALHRAFGFEPIGVFHEAGRKFGRFWSVQWFEKRLGGGGAMPHG